MDPRNCSEVSLDDIDDLITRVEDGQGAPLVESEAGVTDIEGDHVTDA